jgi:uncharacterized protein (DUF2126 family)
MPIQRWTGQERDQQRSDWLARSNEAPSKIIAAISTGPRRQPARVLRLPLSSLPHISDRALSVNLRSHPYPPRAPLPTSSAFAAYAVVNDREAVPDGRPAARGGSRSLRTAGGQALASLTASKSASSAASKLSREIAPRSHAMTVRTMRDGRLCVLMPPIRGSLEDYLD